MSRRGSTATFGGGLNQDVDPVQIPDGDYLFALNAQSDGGVGEKGVISTEMGNKISAAIPEGFIVIGHCYMKDNQIVLFLVNPDKENGSSQIGIFDDTEQYTVHVDFKDLNFSTDHPIEAIFRIRRGCERTIYWVEKGDGNPPRYYIFEQPNKFKLSTGEWSKRQFLLQKSYRNPPSFSKIWVEDGGTLEPGSYSIGIQLLDENLNTTEWICSTGRINVYASNYHLKYSEILGSVNGKSDPVRFGKTSKSISVTIGNIDKSFKYYKLALIRSISTNGTITDIQTTDIIDTNIDNFLFTGNNTVGTISLAEFQQENNLYDGANTIEQIDNRLVLGNVRRSSINWCRLQYYASRINADCVVRKVKMDNIWDTANPKNPICDLGATGYMPGEIYSFGIVYVFEGGIKSPVYHIPGKPGYVKDNTVFSGGAGVYPMQKNNVCKGKFYTTLERNFNYWGTDGQGKVLEGKAVRHHRFPRRDQINVPLVDIKRDNQRATYYALRFQVTGRLHFEKITPIYFKVEYTQRGEVLSYGHRVNPGIYDVTEEREKDITIDIVGEFRLQDTPDFTDIKFYYSIGDGDFVKVSDNPTIGVDHSITLQDSEGDYSGFTNVKYKIYHKVSHVNVTRKNVQGNILGIKFSNIDIPSLDDTNGHKCIGYYIVRNERKAADRTVLDSGILIPTSEAGVFVGGGIINVQFQNHNDNINEGGDGGWQNHFKDGEGGTRFWVHNYKKCYGLFYPSYFFTDEKIDNPSRIRQVGLFSRYGERKVGFSLYNNVMDGSSLPVEKKPDKLGRQGYFQAGNSGNLGDWDKRNDDAREDHSEGAGGQRTGDGYCLSLLSIDTDVNYRTLNNNQGKVINQTDIYDIYYLGAIDHKNVNKDNKQLYNLSCNNKACMIWLNHDIDVFRDYNVYGGMNEQTNIPYVYIEKDNESPYSKFEFLPYHADTMNMVHFSKDDDNAISVYGGDAYISPIRLNSIMFNLIHTAVHIKNKASWIFKWIVGGLLAIGGAVLSILTAGALVGLGLAMAGVGALLIKSGIDSYRAIQVFIDKYGTGLRKCVSDANFGGFHSRAWGADNIIKTRINESIGNLKHSDKDSGVHLVLGREGLSDDAFMWQVDCISDLYFESHNNISLRNRFFNDPSPTFLTAPSDDGSPNNDPITVWGIKNEGVVRYMDAIHSRHPRNELEKYCMNCLSGVDPNRKPDSRKYIGISLGTYYNINKDYHTPHKLKAFFTLPRNYSCTNTCQGKFPNRVIWSKQSFKEELQDNYTSILPNDYVDMDGSTGDLTRLINSNNQLYAFTTQGAWMFPNTIQERVNDGVVTYIGTGEFLSVPARKIVDSNTGLGGGCLHSFSIIKTPYGICYVSYYDKKIYVLRGGSLQPLSNIGMSSWFNKNIPIIVDEDYFKKNKRIYSFRDNTFNAIGSGFVLGYDNNNNRLLVTKKDRFSYSERKGFVVSNGKDRYIFYDYDETIERHKQDGWEYLGIDGISMKFRKFAVNPNTRSVRVRKTRMVKKTIQLPEMINKRAEFITVRIMNQNKRNYFAELKNAEMRTYFTIHNREFGMEDVYFGPFSYYDRFYVSQRQHEYNCFKAIYEGRAGFKMIREGHPDDQSNPERTVEIAYGFPDGCNIDSITHHYLHSINQESIGIGSRQISADYSRNQAIIDNLKTNWRIDLNIFERVNNNSFKQFINYFVIGSHDHLLIRGSYSNNGLNTYSEDYYIIKTGEIKDGYDFNKIDFDIIVFNSKYNLKAWETIEGKITQRSSYTNEQGNHNIILTSISKGATIQDHGIIDATSNKAGIMTYTKDLQHNGHRLADKFYRADVAKRLNLNIPSGKIMASRNFIPSNAANRYISFFSDWDRVEATESWSNNSFHFNQNNDHSFYKIKLSYRFEDGAWIDRGTGRVLFKDGSGKGTRMVDKEIDVEEEYFEDDILEAGKLYPVFMEVPAEPYNEKIVDNSWTASFSFNNNRWVSFHSYIPNSYISTSNNIFSFVDKNINIYKHNQEGIYNNYYGTKRPHIIEFVCKTGDLTVGVFDSISLTTDALKYVKENLHDSRFITFNKAVLYNGRQCSGLLELKAKKTSEANYIYNISNNNDLDISSIDRREKDWNINEFHDIRTDYDTHIWSNVLLDKQNEYFIDKVLNFDSIDKNKHWTELERFRDRYIIIRLIFDSYDDVKLITRMCSTNII